MDQITILPPPHCGSFISLKGAKQLINLTVKGSRVGIGTFIKCTVHLPAHPPPPLTPGLALIGALPLYLSYQAINKRCKDL